MQHEDQFERWLVQHGVQKTERWIRVRNGVPQPEYSVTLPTYVRNSIHHPENGENDRVNNQQIKDSIEIMRAVAVQLAQI